MQLERRLDNVVYSLGFAASRAQARQLVRHGHVQVDSRKVTIPSFQVKAGQAVAIKEASRKNQLIRSSVETARGRGVRSGWSSTRRTSAARVLGCRCARTSSCPIQEQLIVELYSR